MRHAYRIAGLNVSSDTLLPGARAADAARLCDAVIRQTDVPASLASPRQVGRLWEADSDHLLMRVPTVGRFLVIGGREIRYQPEAAAPVGESQVYLIGSVFGALLLQRGQIVLHASAVAVNGEAVLFCGRSGAGKSTLAAALCQQGYPLLGDDFCAIAFDAHGNPRASADSKRHKLTSESIASLQLADRRGAAVQRGVAKYFVEPLGATNAGDVPLGAIYFLGHDDPPGIQALDTADAARLVVDNAYRPGFVKRLGQRPRYFEAAVAILRSVRLFRFTPPRELARLPEAITALEGHWAENRARPSRPRTTSTVQVGAA